MSRARELTSSFGEFQQVQATQTLWACHRKRYSNRPTEQDPAWRDYWALDRELTRLWWITVYRDTDPELSRLWTATLYAGASRRPGTDTANPSVSDA